MDKYGYHVGFAKEPAEALYNVSTIIKMSVSAPKVGWLGTGFYYFGEAEDAQTYANKMKRPIQKIDLSKYNMYVPKDGDTFYEGLLESSQHIANMVKEGYKIEDIKDDIESIAEWFAQIPKINKKDAAKGIVMFFKDLENNSKGGVMLANRILGQAYDGIDNRGNSNLDHYGIGSVIFSQSALDSSTYETIKESLASDMEDEANSIINSRGKKIEVFFTKHMKQRIVDRDVTMSDIRKFFTKLSDAETKKAFVEFLKRLYTNPKRRDKNFIAIDTDEKTYMPTDVWAPDRVGVMTVSKKPDFKNREFDLRFKFPQK